MQRPTPAWSTPELQTLRAQVTRFFAAEISPHMERWSERGYIDRETWRKAGQLGIALPDIAEEYGGGGGDFRHLAVVLEEGGYVAEAAWGVAVHAIVAQYLAAYASAEQKRRWLPRLTAGEWVGAIAMTEPGAGSDLQGIKTRAIRDGDALVINGQKTFITNGWHAGLVIVVAKTDPSEGAKGISLIVVETEHCAGFRRGRLLEKIGQSAQDTVELVFDDVRVPADHILGGQPGQGFYQLMKQLPYERLIIGVRAVATIERALELTLEYVRSCQAFGKSLFDQQNTRFELAEMATEAKIARTFVDRCVSDLVAGKLDAPTACMSKWWTTDKQCEVIDRCLQLFGGYGYMREYPIARMYEDARVQRIYGGANEIMKEVIARSL
ncbi:MAG: acyl-CoA dehydrogenase [Betaproteobacteria bacterium]|nr:acyl-CoA dehydrogenase [Betaproteobacteria bacterium]